MKKKLQYFFGLIKEKIYQGKNKKTRPFRAPRFLANFTWDDFYQSLLSSEKRVLIHKKFIVAALITSGYTAGKMIAIFLDEVTVPKASRYQETSSLKRVSLSQIKSLERHDLFHSNIKNQDHVKKSKISKKRKKNIYKICTSAKKISQVSGLKLVHTTVLQDSVKSLAAVQYRGKIASVHEGEKLDSIVEIGKIERLKMIFKNLRTGNCEYISSRDKKSEERFSAEKIKVLSSKAGKKLLAASHKGIKNEGNSFKIKKSFRNKMLANIGELLTQARAIQIKNSDGSLSFKMTEVVPGSLYSQLDITNGDIIERINGSKISNLNEVMSLFSKIKDIDNMSLTIKRAGISQKKDYSFE